MTFNIIGYLVYIPLTVFITVYVGKQCHTHGLVYVQSAFKNIELAHSINNLLLVGYYLLNIGYAIMGLKNWEYFTSLSELVAGISSHLGWIILILALLHYINIMGLTILKKFHQQIIN